MQPTTAKYKSLPPLARCLLIITALKTKISSQSRFSSVLNQMDYRLPADAKLGNYKLAAVKREYAHLKKEGWLTYRSTGIEAELNTTIDNFELLKMAHSIEPVFFVRIAENVRVNYSAAGWGYHNAVSDAVYTIRDFKIAIIKDNLVDYQQAMRTYQSKISYSSDSILEKAYAEFDNKLNDLSEDGYFQYIGENILQSILSKVLSKSLLDMAEIVDVFPTVEATLEKLFQSADKLGFGNLFDKYAMVLLCRGAFSEFWALCEKYQSHYLIDLFQGLQLLLQGQHEKSNQAFKKGYDGFKKSGYRNTRFPQVHPNIFYFVSRARYLGQHFGVIEKGVKHYAQNVDRTFTISLEVGCSVCRQLAVPTLFINY